MSETKTQFDNQAGDLRAVESYGGQADYLFFQHENPKEGSLPVLVAGGWSEGRNLLREVAQTIYENGREVILIDHARRGGPKRDETDYNPELVQKAQTLLNIIDELDLEKVDVIAHSEGAINATLAASLQPEKFRSLVFVAPAGMIGTDSKVELLHRFKDKAIQGHKVDLKELRQRNPDMAKVFATNGLKFFLSHPLKANREISAIAQARIEEVLPDIKASGIHIGIVQSRSDLGFPASRMEKQVIEQSAYFDQDEPSQTKDLEMKVDSYASAASKWAGHDDLIIHPERSTKAALDMLATFERLD